MSGEFDYVRIYPRIVDACVKIGEVSADVVCVGGIHCHILRFLAFKSMCELGVVYQYPSYPHAMGHKI